MFLGIDGGGSKTAYALVDAEGRLRGSVQGGTTNYNQVGFDGAAEALGDGFARVLSTAGVTSDAITGAVVGIGGVGEIAADMAGLVPAVAGVFDGVPHRLINDCEVGWAGGLGLAPGINVVAGTGSIAFGRDAHGRTMRCGGWAWVVGDEGSAHWLGRQVIQIFTKQSDGRLARTPLYDCVRRRLCLMEDIEIRTIAHAMSRQEMAAFSQVLGEAAALGDATSAELYRQAGRELAMLASAIRNGLSFPLPVRVSGTGGVFAAQPAVVAAFSAALEATGGIYQAPRTTPVLGAVLLAAEAFGGEQLEPIRSAILGTDRTSAMPADAATGSASLLGRSRRELSARQAIHTATEIAQQPDKWRELGRMLEARSAEIASFLAEPFSHADLAIVLTGAGTSAYAGGIVAAEIRARAGRSAVSVPTTSIVDDFRCHLDPRRPTLLVSLARSGDSPESLAAVNIVDQHFAKVWHVVITCNPDGRLALAGRGPNRLCLVMPDGTNDLGFAMTSSFSCMVLASLAVLDARGLGKAVHRISCVADVARSVLQRCAWIDELAQEGHSRVIFLGSGALAPAAAEAALKLLELTDGEIVTTGESPLAFRHGPKAIINATKALVVGFVNREWPSTTYCSDMLGELARDGRADVVSIVPGGMPELGGTRGFVLGSEHADLSDGWLSVAHVAFAQMLALFKSLHLGHAPDDPCPSGEVNRVVQNVNIYETS